VASTSDEAGRIALSVEARSAGVVAARSGDTRLALRKTREALKAIDGLDSPQAIAARVPAIFNMARLHAQAGHPSQAETELREALRLTADDGERWTISIALSELLASAADGGDEATALLDALDDEGGTPSAAMLALLLDARAAISAPAGRFSEALDFSERAAAARANIDDPLAHATGERRRAHALLALERFIEADGLLRGAIVRCGLDAPRLRGLLHLDLAVLEIARGRHGAAEASLEIASQLLFEAGAADRDWARFSTASGTLHRVRGRRRDAAEEHSRALSLLDKAPPEDIRWLIADRANVLIDLGIDHLLERSIRYAREGARLLEDARALLEPLPGRDAEKARCAANLGVARALCGEREAAERALSEAEAHYRAAGRYLEQATVDHNRACLMATDAEAGATELRRALDLIVPAALIRDAARFEVRDGDNRRGWWARQARISYAEALAIAARLDDEQERATLVGDLIVAFRLSGLVSVDAPIDVDARRLGDALQLDREPSEDDSPSEVLRPTLSPRVRMNGEREILRDHLATASSRYRSPGALRSDRVAILL
jgi:tetratricopeptide (TPR) repeat protein